MTDITPRISDAKSLKDLSKILALPTITVAYIFQTGAVIGWGEMIWLDIPQQLAPEIQRNRLILIFVCKAIWSGGIAAIGYSLLAVLHISLDEWVLPITGAILFALALFGLFGPPRFPQLRTIESFWFYAAAVWGFYLFAMTEQLHQQLLPTSTKSSESTAAAAMAGTRDKPH